MAAIVYGIAAVKGNAAFWIAINFCHRIKMLKEFEEQFPSTLVFFFFFFFPIIFKLQLKPIWKLNLILFCFIMLCFPVIPSESTTDMIVCAKIVSCFVSRKP